MQLTRCCFVFLVQGSLYLVSGPRGAAPRGGGREDWGRAREASKPENFLPSPQHPGDGAEAWRLGERAGPRPETGQKGLIGAGRGCWAGPPTRPLVAGGATGTRENARSRRQGLLDPFPGPGPCGRVVGDGCGADDLPGQGLWALP